jgi:hypothetical protein
LIHILSSGDAATLLVEKRVDKALMLEEMELRQRISFNTDKLDGLRTIIFDSQEEFSTFRCWTEDPDKEIIYEAIEDAGNGKFTRIRAYVQRVGNVHYIVRANDIEAKLSVFFNLHHASRSPMWRALAANCTLKGLPEPD